MTHGSLEPQAAILGLFLYSQNSRSKPMQTKERGLLLIWGQPPDPRDFERHESLSSDETAKAGARSRAPRPFSSSDELTGLFLSTVASPQSRPPLHPMRSPYKRPLPTQVLFRIKHNFSFTPSMYGNILEGNGEIPRSSAKADRIGKSEDARR
jgi:hypothetical protein